MASVKLSSKKPIRFGLKITLSLIFIFIILSAATLIIFLQFWLVNSRPTAAISAHPETATVQINQQTIGVEVVRSEADMYQGLSGRSGLCPACGMLFVFSTSQERQFVMRNMNIPLDIIFINNHKIIKIAANLPPEGAAPQVIYDSGSPADQVLEVNSGYAARQGIKTGDEVTTQY